MAKKEQNLTHQDGSEIENSEFGIRTGHMRLNFRSHGQKPHKKRC